MTRDELFSLVIPAPDEAARKAAKKRWDGIAKPIDGLGRLEELICRIAAIEGREDAQVTPRGLIIMCADNGVVEEGVSQTSQEVTLEVARLMGQKKSSVGVMTESCPLKAYAVDIGIDSGETPEGVIDRKVRRGSANIAKGPAMTEEECLRAVSVGIGLARKSRDEGCRLLATGEMGIGNTTTSAALLCALTGAEPAAVTGRGAGLSDEGLLRKLAVVERALELHRKEMGCRQASTQADALEALRRLGGLDIAGLAGVFIGGALFGIPVIIDGLISATAALAAEQLAPGCRAYMLASHRGREKGTMIALERLGLYPVIDADLALGEGTGAVLLFPLLDMAMSLYRSGLAFGEAEIEAYRRFEG
ncbi:MAG: nicotinate-nucleotide--dimethylbenzimidazole phosphoribosyltransferase [Lachnospiraceae bacterium]|nr:nicotinate-nucleotide--dimethylbenzimidazole phosphoribosyltransferase [Lachnospiraceae bacterium]